MKNGLISGLILVSSVAFSQNATLGHRMLDATKDSLAVAIFSDLPVNFMLGVKDPYEIEVQTVSAAVGYAIRNIGNAYFNNTDQNTRNPYLAAAIGCVGGATKYTGRAYVLGQSGKAARMLLGCVDGASYEGTSHLRGNRIIPEYVALEVGVALLSVFLGLKEVYEVEAKDGIKTGLAIAASIQTTYAAYEYLTMKFKEFWNSESKDGEL